MAEGVRIPDAFGLSALLVTFPPKNTYTRPLVYVVGRTYPTTQGEAHEHRQGSH